MYIIGILKIPENGFDFSTSGDISNRNHYRNLSAPERWSTDYDHISILYDNNWPSYRNFKI